MVQGRDKFSVLMSVYHAEKSNYLYECLKSLSLSSIIPDEIIIVQDGPINDELRSVINSFRNILNIKSPKLEENSGLSKALNYGLTFCTYEIVARMDTDDVCRTDRFEVQLDYFKENQELILLGSNVDEFITDVDEPLFRKKMPIDGKNILNYAKRRNPFNHPTVMFKKSKVINLGGYENMPLFEDYLLWMKMLDEYGYEKFANIDDSLVMMRTVPDLYRRRGGIDYVSKVKKFRGRLYKQGYISLFDFLYVTTIIGTVSLLPNNLRSKIYQKKLRNKL